MKKSCAILGSGNIGTDLLFKLVRSAVLDVRALVGIDPKSEGLRRAERLGIETSAIGIQYILDARDEFDVIFDATSAYAHHVHAPLLAAAGLLAVDLTPAAIGPPIVPSVNLECVMGEKNVSLITCGGQATIPIVAAISKRHTVPYAEIVATISSLSAGPGTRQNIDEFTVATAAGLESIGGAAVGKAIIVLNPADPPILMRNTIHCGLPGDFDEAAVIEDIVSMVDDVRAYVPGYRLRREPMFERRRFLTPGGPAECRVTVFTEVEGAGDYLPPYAGNLDIMTSAAVRAGELLANQRHPVAVP